MAIHLASQLVNYREPGKKLKAYIHPGPLQAYIKALQTDRHVNTVKRPFFHSFNSFIHSFSRSVNRIFRRSLALLENSRSINLTLPFSSPRLSINAHFQTQASLSTAAKNEHPIAWWYKNRYPAMRCSTAAAGLQQSETTFARRERRSKEHSYSLELAPSTSLSLGSTAYMRQPLPKTVNVVSLSSSTIIQRRKHLRAHCYIESKKTVYRA